MEEEKKNKSENKKNSLAKLTLSNPFGITYVVLSVAILVIVVIYSTLVARAGFEPYALHLMYYSLAYLVALLVCEIVRTVLKKKIDKKQKEEEKK